MGHIKLKLNPDKTEFKVIGDDQIRSSLKSSFPVSWLGNILEPAESVKSLGVILDAENSMQRHVAYLCGISYYHLRELQRVCRYLDHETAVKVANALVRLANKINLVMSHPSCTSFITIYCSNIISLLIKQYISANLHICPL